MAQIRRILGTSLFSLILVIWGLFMVCSGRVPDVQYDDDFAAIEEDYDSEQADLMNQLAMLDEESTKLEPDQKAEILQALGVEQADPASSGSEEDFLTEELFLDLEVEIAELERLARQKAALIDSLKGEIEEADLQLAAVESVVGESGVRLASSERSGVVPALALSNGSATEYELSYQDALNEVYNHNYEQAIARFRSLLKLDDKNKLADNCQYWIGECYYALKKYEVAIAEFEKVFAFEDNNKADDAQFMIGQSYLRMGQTELAQIELNNLLTFYSNSEYVARAEQKLLDLDI